MVLVTIMERSKIGENHAVLSLTTVMIFYVVAYVEIPLAFYL